MDYTNLTDADLERMTDAELEAVSNMSDDEIAAKYGQGQAQPEQQGQRDYTDEELEAMTDDELAVIASGGSLAKPPAAPTAQLKKPAAPRYDPQNIGRVQTLVTPDEAKRMPKMGGAEFASLQVQSQGGPMAEKADGSVSNWLGNFWNAVSYNSSGKLTAKNTAMNNQDILRGTVRKDGKEVPLTQLDDSELDYLVDAAGWNGPGAYFRRFLGKWARSNEGIMQDWDRTQGAKIADPVARKQARVRYAQDIARMNVEQQEGEKLAAQTEIDNRRRQTGAGVVSGGITMGSYMLPYMIPGAHGVVAGAIEGADRAQELLSDRYAVDQNGNIGVAAERDSTGAAIAKGAARGVIAPLIEFAGGELATGALKGIVNGTLGKIPLVRNVGGKFVETAVGKAVNGYMRSMSRFGKVTGLQSFPVEAIEELEDQVVDSALGLNTRSSETEGNFLTRGVDSAAQFLKPESLMDLAESMLLVQVFGGGIAALNDRTRSKAIDNILARDLGVTPDKLKGYSADEKWAAYEEYTNRLTPEEVEKKFDAGRRAIDELTTVMGESDAELRDFEEAAGATRTGEVIDDKATRAAEAATEAARVDANMVSANAAEGERRAGEMLNPEQAFKQQKSINDAKESEKIPALARRAYFAKLDSIARSEADSEMEEPSSVGGGLDLVEESFRVASEAVDSNRAEYDRWLADAGREDSPQARVDWFVRTRTDVAAAEAQMRLQAAEQGEETELPEPEPPSRADAPKEAEPKPTETMPAKEMTPTKETSENGPTGAPSAEGATTPTAETKPAEAVPRASDGASAVSEDTEKQRWYEIWLLDKAIDDAIKAGLPDGKAVSPLPDTPENRAAFEEYFAKEEASRKATDEALASQREMLAKNGENGKFIDWLERHKVVVVNKQDGDGAKYALDKELADYARNSFNGSKQKVQTEDSAADTEQKEPKKNTLRTANGMSPKVFREYTEWLDIEGKGKTLPDTPDNQKRFLAEREEEAAAKKLDVGKLRKEGEQTVVTPEEAQSLPQTVDEIVDIAAKVFGVTPEFDKQYPGNEEYRNEIRQTVESLTPEKRLQYAKLLKAQADEGGYSKQTAAAERRIGWEEANGMLLGRTKKPSGLSEYVNQELAKDAATEARKAEAEARKAEAEARKAEAEAKKAEADAETDTGAGPIAGPVASGNRQRIAPEPVKNDALAAFMPEASRGKATFREEQMMGGSAVFVDGKNTGVFVGGDGKFFIPNKQGKFDSFDKAQAFLNREATNFKTGQRVSFKADDGTIVSGQAIVRPDGPLAIRTKQKDPRNPFANVVKDVEVPKDKMSSVTKIGVRESRVEASETVPETWDAKVKAEVERAAERVKGWLKGVKVKFADGPSEGSAESRDLRDGNGNVVGSYDRATNEVTLYPGATVKTVAHEIGWHATYKFAEDEAKAGRTQLKQTLDGYIDNVPKVVKDAVKAAYGDLSEDAMRDEIGAHVFEQKHGAELDKALRTMEGRAWYNRVWDAIKRVAGQMLKAFGVDVSKVDLAKLERMKPEDGMAWLAKQFAEGKTLGDMTPVMERERGSKLREKVQDSNIEVRNVQDDIGGVQDKVDANGHTALDSQDVYAAKMRANGYVEQGIRDIQQRRDNLSKVLADNDISPDAFDKFLTAMHAEERNRTTSARDKRAYDPTDKFGSGMSEVDAKAYLASPEVTAKRAAFDEAAKIVWDMNKADLKRRLDSGRISQDQYDLLTNQWQHYVPLRTDAENGSLNAFNMSTAGFRANEFAMAKGRESEAASPTAFSFLQAQQGVNGSERNVVNTTLANLVRHAEASGKPIGEIVEGEMQPRGAGWTFEFADGERVVADGASKLAANHDNIVLFKEDGILKAIRIQPGKEGRGNDFAKAVTGENVGKWGEGLQWIPRMTRFMSEMRTQYSPTFSLRNALADHLESQQAFIGRFGLRDGLALAKDAIKAEFRENGNLRAYLRDGTLNGRVKEFVEGGGLIKGGVAAMGFSGEVNEIRDTYAKYVRKAKGFAGMTNAERAKALWDGTFDFIKGANEILENSTRLGIFSALRDKGVPIQDAIKFAREATVDFNRKGTAMPWFNGLYMFANAAMQGTTRAGRAFIDDWSAKPTSGLGSNRKMRGELTATLIALGVAKAVLDHFLGDDDGREKAGKGNARNLTEYDKKHLLGVPIPGGNQLVLLRTRGPYASIPYIAQTLANVALGETDWEDAAKNIATEVGSQAVDIAGGNGIGSKSEALQTLMPSVGDPFVQWATGTDYKGDERVRRTFDRTQPASHNGRDSTSAAFKAAAKSINFITGGNENRKGFLDWAPEDIQLAWDTVFGGVGRDVSNIAEGAENAYRRFVKGEKPERGFSAYPFLKDMVREYPENTQRFYDAFGRYEADKAEFKKTTDMRRRAEMKRVHPYLSQGKGRVDNLKDMIDELRHLEKNEVKNGNKWVARKQPISDERRNKFRERRLRLQASVLKILGE